MIGNMDTKKIVLDMFPSIATKFPKTHAARIEKIARWCEIHLRMEGRLPYEGDIAWMYELESVDEMDEFLQKWEVHLQKWRSFI